MVIPKKTEKKKKKARMPKTQIVARSRGVPIVMDNVERFTREFLKNGGNVEQAALAVGQYTNKASARVCGARWLRKAKERGLVQNALEKKGYGYGKLIDIALERMEKSKKPDWWDRIMKMADYEDFTSSGKQAGPNVNVNIPFFSAHRKLSEEYVEGAVEGAVEGVEEAEIIPEKDNKKEVSDQN